MAECDRILLPMSTPTPLRHTRIAAVISGISRGNPIESKAAPHLCANTDTGPNPTDLDSDKEGLT